MKTDAFYATQDPDKRREIALTLHADLTRSQDANLALTLRISELEEALKLARQARFGRKGEAFTGEQRQLAEEDSAADRAGITRQLRGLMPERDGPNEPPRKSRRLYSQ